MLKPDVLSTCTQKADLAAKWFKKKHDADMEMEEQNRVERAKAVKELVELEAQLEEMGVDLSQGECRLNFDQAFVGLARPYIYIYIYIRGIFGWDLIRYTVIYGVYTRLWPALNICSMNTVRERERREEGLACNFIPFGGGRREPPFPVSSPLVSGGSLLSLLACLQGRRGRRVPRPLRGPSLSSNSSSSNSSGGKQQARLRGRALKRKRKWGREGKGSRGQHSPQQKQQVERGVLGGGRGRRMKRGEGGRWKSCVQRQDSGRDRHSQHLRWRRRERVLGRVRENKKE